MEGLKRLGLLAHMLSSGLAHAEVPLQRESP